MKIAQNFTKRALILYCFIVFIAGLIILSGCEKKEEKIGILKQIDINNTNKTKAGVAIGMSKGVKCSADDPNCISTLKKECPDSDPNCKTSFLTECKVGDPNCKTPLDDVKTSVLTECKVGDPNCKTPLDDVKTSVLTECKAGDPNCKVGVGKPVECPAGQNCSIMAAGKTIGYQRWCGDDICEGDPIENFEICPQDCKLTNSICGDGICEAGKEAPASCPVDCVS
jgi:hypothetical protein